MHSGTELKKGYLRLILSFMPECGKFYHSNKLYSMSHRPRQYTSHLFCSSLRPGSCAVLSYTLKAMVKLTAYAR